MHFTQWTRVAVLAFVASGSTIFAQTFKAGAGQSDIQTSPSMFPIAEFTGQHDPASVRVLLLDDGTQRIGLLTVDTPSIQTPSVVRWKAILTKATGTTTENVLVISTHDTPAPHISATGVVSISPEDHGQAPAAARQPASGTGAGPAPRAQNAGGRTPPTAAQIANATAYAKAVEDAIEAAGTKAAATLQPVQVGFGLGTSRINVNSQLLTPKGWTNGLDDEGFVDPSLALIRFSSLDGKPVAWLMDYAVRPAIMERFNTQAGGALISGDLIGVARHYLETQYGSSATATFLMGAAADQQPLFTTVRSIHDKDGNSSQIDIHEAGFTLVDLIGERLGSDAVRVNEAIKASTVPATMRLVRQSVEVETQARQQADGADLAAPSSTGRKVAIPYVMLQIGDIAIVGLMHELNATTGVKIRTESPFPHTIVATMVDGSNGSLEDVSVYDRKMTSSLNSLYARGSAEAVATAIEAQLRQLHNTSGAGAGGR